MSIYPRKKFTQENLPKKKKKSVIENNSNYYALVVVGFLFVLFPKDSGLYFFFFYSMAFFTQLCHKFLWNSQSIVKIHNYITTDCYVRSKDKESHVCSTDL